MDTLKITIDRAKNTISVYNNGRYDHSCTLTRSSGVPIKIHKDEGVHVPELIFGHLLTSSNYNDSQKKTTGTLGLPLTLKVVEMDMVPSCATSFPQSLSSRPETRPLAKSTSKLSQATWARRVCP
jgi:hypothetical protein